jgi:PAS domain S-box-containing protein
VSQPPRPSVERRVLILAPTGRDAQLTRSILAEVGIRSLPCDSLAMLGREMAEGAGALLLSEEAVMSESDMFFLGERLAHQPPWSDLPVLLLAHTGADSAAVRKAIRALGNVTLLERPVRVASLVSAAQTALRARNRQYHARERLQELDQVARALTDSEARLQALFANAAVGIAELTDEGRLALVNDALCRILGQPREALVGSTLFQHAHAEDRAGIESAYRAVMQAPHANFSGERRFERRGGEPMWAKLSITATPQSGEAAMRAVAVIEDVTERRQAEHDLREADRRKDEFIATLAHELRNPLAPIRNSLHIVRMAGSQEPAIQRVAAMMERQVRHMVRMVDDLLEVSRISRGKIELRRERVSLAAVLRSAVDTSRPLIEAGGHDLRLDLPDESVAVDGDPVRLAQVFANLLNNSAKYTSMGGRIEVSVSLAEGAARICVKDNGEGIPPEMLDKVFHMFTQVDAGSRAQGGLGIGLTLARTLVHLHGGTIDARSEGRGAGCEFLIRLPLAPEASTRPAAPAAPREANGKLRRVLVVDDNHDAADSLGMLLQFLGAETMTVHDGRSCLDAVQTFRPAVVLLDVGMPGMSGLEVARRLREDPGLRETTLVALTGWGQRDDRRRTREAGFDYHLVKPADLATLQSILALRDGEAHISRSH